jgi:hypothetical protein
VHSQSFYLPFSKGLANIMQEIDYRCSIPCVVVSISLTHKAVSLIPLHEKGTSYQKIDAGWFHPDKLPDIPPEGSVARRLIDEFKRRSKKSRHARLVERKRRVDLLSRNMQKQTPLS